MRFPGPSGRPETRCLGDTSVQSGTEGERGWMRGADISPEAHGRTGQPLASVLRGQRPNLLVTQFRIPGEAAWSPASPLGPAELQTEVFGARLPGSGRPRAWRLRGRASSTGTCESLAARGDQPQAHVGGRGAQDRDPVARPPGPATHYPCGKQQGLAGPQFPLVKGVGRGLTPQAAPRPRDLGCPGPADAPLSGGLSGGETVAPGVTVWLVIGR